MTSHTRTKVLAPPRCGTAHAEPRSILQEFLTGMPQPTVWRTKDHWPARFRSDGRSGGATVPNPLVRVTLSDGGRDG